VSPEAVLEPGEGERDGASAGFSVVICTRNRPAQLERTLGALRRQSLRDFEVIVVDQSDRSGPRTASQDRLGPRLRVVRDAGRGLSRARNLGWRAASTEWIAYLDDDCLPEPGWAAELARALARRPEASIVSGHVGERRPSKGEYLRVSVFEVDRERMRHGRWTRPWEVGLGVCIAIRRRALLELGGFDERLGAGTTDFPAAEDMDFNYRLLRSGGAAYATPEPRAVHDQWRAPAELGPLYRGYMAGWCGFAMKHLRGGDVLGGVWLWWAAAVDSLRMLASSLRRRSRLRFVVACWKLRGLAGGTVKGLRAGW
jgi:GT2 family glycosyltransferase